MAVQTHSHHLWGGMVNADNAKVNLLLNGGDKFSKNLHNGDIILLRND